MRITAKDIQLRNLQQLAQATSIDGITVMGRLESVAFAKERYTYQLVIGGNTLHVPADHPLDIRRTAEADALVVANDVHYDIADSLEAEHAA